MAEHTPTPWKTDAEVGHEAILGPDGLMVADCSIFHRKIKASRLPANAAFIVKAVNNHDALVKALRDLEEANDRLAALRTQEMYLAMLDAGQEFVLADLQDARNAANRLLASVSGSSQEAK